MDLTFSDEQEMLRAAVREVCAKFSSPDAVRALEDDPTGYSPELHEQLAKMDLIGLTIGEQYGGAGQSALENVVVHEEFGRALVASPHFVSSIIASRILEGGGTDSQRDAWLPKIARGEAILTPAWLEPGGGCSASSVRARVEGGRLTGAKTSVAFASSAARLIVSARDGDEVGLYLVDPAGATLTYQRTLAQDASFSVTFDGAQAEPIPGGWRAWEDASIDGQIAVAAYAVGGAERALELAIQYAKEREQFGRKIGSFQGIAHPLADLATEIAGARTLVHQAAWTRASGAPIGPLAAMAKLYAADVFKRTTKFGEQVFGGVGFTLAPSTWSWCGGNRATSNRSLPTRSLTPRRRSSGCGDRDDDLVAPEPRSLDDRVLTVRQKRGL